MCAHSINKVSFDPDFFCSILHSADVKMFSLSAKEMVPFHFSPQWMQRGQRNNFVAIPLCVHFSSQPALVLNWIENGLWSSFHLHGLCSPSFFCRRSVCILIKMLFVRTNSNPISFVGGKGVAEGAAGSKRHADRIKRKHSKYLTFYWDRRLFAIINVHYQQFLLHTESERAAHSYTLQKYVCNG